VYSTRRSDQRPCLEIFAKSRLDKKYGLVTPSLPSLPPSTSLGSITSHLLALRSNPTKPSPPANLTISSVGALGEARAAMPVLPPGGGVAICAVGRARWEVEWKKGSERPMTRSPEEVREGGLEAVLRVPVGWSGDHRVVRDDLLERCNKGSPD
jgi:2-oxoisovalerate dehydrogenase E2 component (dihydrolipoyl transacylase)